MRTTFKKLTEKEKEALKPIVKRALDQSRLDYRVTDSGITYLDEGAFKAVYRVDSDVPILAVAASKEHGPEFPEEFRRLQLLHEAAPNFFPQPYDLINLEEEQKNVLLMEFLDSLRINKFKEQNPNLEEEIVDSIGYAAGFVYGRTGMFTKEPHDGNILLKLEDGIVKTDFIDVDHFDHGSDDELFNDYFLWNGWGRTECIANPRIFEDAFDKGLEEATN